MPEIGYSELLDKKNERPSWDEYFLTIAQLVSKRSTCLRRNAGAVIVQSKRILSTGYNGVPSKIAHCQDVGCLREKLGVESGKRHELCRGLHAEQNAIIQAALHGIKIEDAVIYTTLFPCSLCAKMLINSSIKKVYYLEGYPDELSVALLDEAKIDVKKLEF
jgi:dCMP deaminase